MGNCKFVCEPCSRDIHVLVAGEKQGRGKAFRQPTLELLCFPFSSSDIGEKPGPREHTHTDTEARRALRTRGSLYQSCDRGRKKLLLITAEFLLICHVLTTKEGAIEGKLVDILCNAGKQIESRQRSSKYHLPSL